MLVPLAVHSEDIGDPNLPWMLWFAAEESIGRTPDLAIELVKTTVHGLTRRFAARHIAAEVKKDPGTLNLLVAGLGEMEDASWRGEALDGMLDALSGSRGLQAPEAWAATYERLAARAGEEEATKLAQLAVVFSDRKALATFRRIAGDAGSEMVERRRALTVLVQAGDENLRDLLVEALNEPELATVAMRGLVRAGAPDAGELILKRYGTLSPAESRVAISLLASRRETAAQLLEAVQSGTIRRGEISAYDARQIKALGDKDLSGKLEKLWGTLRSRGKGKEEAMARFRELLASADSGLADRHRGRVLFEQRCGACHLLWGEGGRAGPDLTGSNRRNLDYLLENILDPNALVPANYRTTIVTLKNGQVLSGYVEEELGTAIRLRSQEELHTIPRGQIAKKETLKMSLMPEGVLNGLQDQEVRDLFAYLRGEQQVSRAKEGE